MGIRTALGAQPRQLLLRMRQLSIGLLVFSLRSVGVLAAAGIGVRPAAAMVLTVATVMAIVASVAALGQRGEVAVAGGRGVARRGRTG